MLNLYRIPGAYVFAFVGKFGVGKTLGLVEQGLLMANTFRLSLSCNFELNHSAVRRYCRAYGLDWFAANGRIRCFSNIRDLMFVDDSVLLLDEGGVELFARDFRRTDRELFDRLFRIRHFGSFLFYSCQKETQVDKQFRDMTHIWIYCEGFQRFDVGFRRSRLYSRTMYAFSPDAYEEWCESRQVRQSKFRKYLLSEFRFATSQFWLDDILSHVRTIISYLFSLRPTVIAALFYSVRACRRRTQPLFPYCAFWFLERFSQSASFSFKTWYRFHHRPCKEKMLFACFDSFAARHKKIKKGVVIGLLLNKYEFGLNL